VGERPKEQARDKKEGKGKYRTGSMGHERRREWTMASREGSVEK